MTWRTTPIVLLALTAIAGCGGDDGPERFQVSGRVTYGGEPIPSGEVVIEPDATKGNRGPQSRAVISDGRYQTPSDKGSVNGPVILRVHGHDGKPHPENKFGLPLFYPAHESKADLPREDTTHDIEVPADYGK